MKTSENRIQLAIAEFKEHFGYDHQLAIQAPGRVNLIGEHTDYNEGFVLPCAINFGTVVVGARRNDSSNRVVALDYLGERDEFHQDCNIQRHSKYLWAQYIRGVVHYLKVNGQEFSGADLLVTGNVPQGAGLSSSASLEVAIGQLFKELYQLPLTQTEIALIGQQAENEFVGCRCRIMDQLISANGQKGNALLIDCRSLEFQAVPIPDDVTLLIVNSNIKRGLVEGEYNTRREQCEVAAKSLGVKSLRDTSLGQLISYKERLEPIIFKRARHVITENLRTLQAVNALKENDMALLSRLMMESHDSMKDDFEITHSYIDYLVELIRDQIGEQGGVRMTGGGFGGCVVALVSNQLVESVCETINEQYQDRVGIKETIYYCHASAGARAL